MSGKGGEPTATTFAILGLLAPGPSSGYELAQRMQIGYGFYWPRARSHVFTEAKKIERLGWAEGVPRRHGARRRTEYRITRAGRATLRRWLATPATTFHLEAEHLVRVYLAGFSTTEDLQAVLDDARGRAQAMLEIAESVISDYEAGEVEGPQDEPHLRALLVDFLTGFAHLTETWADRSQHEVAAWSTMPAEERRRRAVERMSAMPRASNPHGGAAPDPDVGHGPSQD